MSNMQLRNYRLPPLPSGRIISMNIELKSEKVNFTPIYQQIAKSTQRIPFEDETPRALSRKNSYEKINRIRSGSISRASSDQRRSQNLSRDRSKDSRNSSSEKNSREKTEQAPHYNLKLRMSIPTVTAKSWSVYEMKQEKYIYGKRNFKKREIASLTKIMNFMTILTLMEQYQLSASKIRVRVSREASCIIGTTAELKHDMELTVQNLFYGMMLPSGNDAAYQIAQIGGAILSMIREKQYVDKNLLYDIEKLTEYYQSKNNTVALYLAQMNKLSKQFKMINSNFANPHGLSNPNNYSTADDVCKLAIEVMKNQTFRDVVATRKYSCTCGIYNGYQDKQNKENQKKYGQSQQSWDKTISQKQGITLSWQNTNKMLDKGWSGIKTGITPNAGPCLAASIKQNVFGKDVEFIVVLINSISMEARWKQVQQIVQWVISHQLYC